MRLTGTEARHLLAPWVHDHRRVRCVFASPGLNDARSGVLWSLDANFLTIRQSNDAREDSIDLHVPFDNVAIEFFTPKETPPEIRPAEALDGFDGALYLHEPELSESGAAIELTWTVWIAQRTSAAGVSAS